MITPLKVVHGSEIRNIDNFFKNTSDEQIDKIIDDIENERIAYSTWKRTGSNMLIEPPPYSYKCSFQRNLTVQQHGSKVDSP
jgi:hypothetical protein